MIYKLRSGLKDNDLIALMYSNKTIFEKYSWRINDIIVRFIKGKFIITGAGYNNKIVILMDG